MTFPAGKFDAVCARIASGESLLKICQGKGMPTRETFFTWIRDNPERRAAYIEACAVRELVYVESFTDILEALGVEPTANQINLARLKIDTRKWTAARLQPKVFGNHIALDDERPGVIVKDFTGKQPYYPPDDAKAAGSTGKI